MNPKLKDFNHVDLLYPSKYVKCGDLRGRDVHVTISDIDPQQDLPLAGGASKKGNVVHFKETEKMLVMNKTNAKIIAGLYGTEVMAWIGKKITLYQAKATFGGKEVDAIRVRAKVPPTKSPSKVQMEEPQHDTVTGEVTPDSDAWADAERQAREAEGEATR